MDKVDVNVLEYEDHYMKFIISGINPAFANSLRRVVLSEVPTMAIKHVLMLDNSSVLFDEILAHRLALVPLKTDLEGYVLPEECSCGGAGCRKCQVRLYLKVESFESPITVYSGHMRSDDPNVVPIRDDIPIVKLKRGQRVELEAYAQLGRGRDHAKWQPVSCCAYKYLPVVKLRGDRCTLCGKCVEMCPKRVLVIEEGRGLKCINQLACSMCRSCEEACPNEAVEVSWRDDILIFIIESVGSLNVDAIIFKALDMLEGKFEEFIEEVESIIEGRDVGEANGAYEPTR